MTSLLSRVDGLEAQNNRFRQEKEQLHQKLIEHQHDIKQLTEENARLSQTVLHHQRDIKRLSNENRRMHLADDALRETNAALEQRVERLEAVSSRHTAALNPSPEPDTRSQFMAFACTLDVATMACPKNRTILMKSATYGRYDDTCGDCCTPNPELDCTELVEENRPSDWLAIQALCDEQISCQFENPGTVLDDCSDQTSEYMHCSTTVCRTTRDWTSRLHGLGQHRYLNIEQHQRHNCI